MKKIILALAATLALVGCTHRAAGPVLGIMLMYSEDGQLVGAEALGQSPDMAACRRIAAKVLDKPHDPSIKIACAQLEVQ